MEFKSSYFKTHLMFLFVFGVSMIPIKNEHLKKLYKVYSPIYVFMVIYVLTFLELMRLRETKDDLSQFTFQLSYCITHVLGTIKTTIVLWKKDDFVKLLHKLETGIFAADLSRGGIREKELIQISITYAHFHLWWFYFVCVLIISSRVIFVAIDDGIPTEYLDLATNTTYTVFVKETPYACWVPFEVTRSPMYELISVYQILSYSTQGIHIGALDAIICGCMMNMASQFLILKGNLESVVKTTQRKSKTGVRGLEIDDEVASKVHEKVIENVKHHQKILEFCDEIEDQFSYLMLLQFISTSLSICFILFQLSLIGDRHSLAFYSMVGYVFLMTGQIFMYCYAGNQVMHCSDELSTYIFHCRWVPTSRATKRHLLMMMTRAQRPTRFTAGKFSILSLQTFVTILRASVSYFMVLRQTNNNKHS